MRILIVGAGEVGSNIAASLAESHDVVVVDRDADRVEALQYAVDILAVAGDGTDLDVLEEAGVDEADLVIASTDSDEANVVVCGTAKTVSDAFTIARVRRPSLLRTWERSRGAFGVDHMVSVDLLTARSVVRIAGLPGAQDVESFAEGRVRMAQFPVGEDSPVADLTVSEADRYDELTFAAVLRGDEVIVPTGETRIEPGDDLVVIGTPESCRRFATEVAPGVENGEVVVLGGGSIGYHVARLFGERGGTVRMVERDPDLAARAAEDLPGTAVLQNDPTDLEFLRREHVGDADMVVATLDVEERNLLVSLLAKHLGAERAVAVVESADYVELFEAVGVDVGVDPHEVTAEEITRFTREERAEKVAIVEADRGEVIEVEVDDDSVLAGRSIREAAADLPEGVVVGAITRLVDGDTVFVTPRGDTVVETGDHVVVFVDADHIDAAVSQL